MNSIGHEGHQQEKQNGDGQEPETMATPGPGLFFPCRVVPTHDLPPVSLYELTSQWPVSCAFLNDVTFPKRETQRNEGLYKTKVGRCLYRVGIAALSPMFWELNKYIRLQFQLTLVLWQLGYRTTQGHSHASFGGCCPL